MIRRTGARLWAHISRTAVFRESIFLNAELPFLLEFRELLDPIKQCLLLNTHISNSLCHITRDESARHCATTFLGLVWAQLDAQADTPVLPVRELLARGILGPSIDNHRLARLFQQRLHICTCRKHFGSLRSHPFPEDGHYHKLRREPRCCGFCLLALLLLFVPRLLGVLLSINTAGVKLAPLQRLALLLLRSICFALCALFSR
mmetsp:Transcript_7826/g.17104  ORF Transcript_7826/g.17104 Transcript_7826/m.17104 type:complete len:204 (-) Transcript_7826:78-689(-)